MLGLLLAAASVFPAYVTVDLAAPSPSFATAVSARGEVVGRAGSSAFAWKDGALRSLGTMTPAPDIGPAISVAFAVNDAGTIVGSNGDDGAGPMDGLSLVGDFVYRGGAMQPVVLGNSQGGAENQRAFGINDAGTIVGVSGYRGYVYDGQVRLDVPPLSRLDEGNGTVAVAINRSGTVVGATTTGRDPAGLPRIHAFAWHAPWTAPIVDLGTLPGFRDSIAMAISADGTIAGYTSKGDPQADGTSGKYAGRRDENSLAFDQLPKDGRAFIWRNGTMHDLGALDATGASAALGINNRGTIVGISHDRAVAWFDGRIADLNALAPQAGGWVLRCATGVNDDGWIVGWKKARAGERRAFLLKPKA